MVQAPPVTGILAETTTADMAQESTQSTDQTNQAATPAPSNGGTDETSSGQGLMPSRAQASSGSAAYSAAMSAHIVSALRHQMSPPSNTAHEPPSKPIDAGIDPANFSSSVGQIVTHAAVREAQTQWRTQAALRSVAESNGEADRTTSTASGSTPSTTLAISDYLEHLGLSHIPMPSEGLHQSFGSSSSKWDSGDPRMGFTLSGVPSMPLMPTPPLQMLPPPASPSFRRTRLRGVRSFEPSSANSVDTDGEPNAMSPFPYPFQVVQSPGGTARAGWWVPPSQAPITVQEQASVSSLGSQQDQGQFFQPTYRDFTKDEFSSLATAAAYATAALTSISATSGTTSTWRQLEASEQETIATQLRAWAGLEGPDRQEQARKALEERQQQIISQTTQTSHPTGSSESSLTQDELTHPKNASRFFPPDFASHYRTQLQALAEGYYTKLHNDGLSQIHYPQPHDSAADSQSKQQSSISDQTVQADLSNLLDIDQSPVSTPKLGAGAQDPAELLSAASSAAGCDVASPQVRDQLLQYAHGLYSQGSNRSDQKGVDKLNPSLLPLLHTLHKLHPTHLPTLLLISCAYYAADVYAGSLWYNNLILRIDPNYVESMSNIGTTLRALGRFKEAESWWWKAVRLRPGYWDAYENLLGVMCSPTPDQTSLSAQGSGKTDGPRFKEALHLCDFVEAHVVGKQHLLRMPQCLPVHLPLTQAPRLQNLFYAKGNLKFVLPDQGAVPAAKEYQKAVEIVISPDSSNRYSLRDLVVATCAVGLLSMGAKLPGTTAASVASEVAQALGINVASAEASTLLSTGSFSAFCPGGILALVKKSGDTIVQTLLRLGNGHIPMVMLLPEAASQLCKVIFAESGAVLPALSTISKGKKSPSAASLQQAQKQAAQTTSTILLTIAKLFQDATASPMPGPHGSLNLGGIPPSISLILPLYYLSISVHPSASTYNNLGILLSSIPFVTTVLNSIGQPQLLNGQALAMQYYTHGLQLDPRHPHIYTNLGSLLKDLGHLNEAIKMYEKAVECNPAFDVALANLGNAIKDQGRTQDSISYYRRAVQINPNFPEALCGLVNALLAVCDWREVYPSTVQSESVSWMHKVSELVSKQLKDGSQYGAGAFQTVANLENWVKMVVRAMNDTRQNAIGIWTERLKPFFAAPFSREEANVCEGGYLIQLIERMMRRSQRKWFVDAYGIDAVRTATELPRPVVGHGRNSEYLRPKLPSCLVTPAVPTVLPFHTFTYPLSARQIRLICHRNSIRISQSSLTQHWLPDAVYPPPSPPSPKINIGYISSDLNNHPLAHLMQSVFGFHDLTKFNVFVYATSASDGSPYRLKIEQEAQHFLDVSTWSNQQIVERVVMDNIHVLMNLNGYTKGARNEVFAARPCPVQMEFMGFAGSMASCWTDWVVADPIVCPPEMTGVDRWRLQNARPQRPTDLAADLDPEESSDDWVYADRFVYMPHSYFVNDHKQEFRDTSTDTNGTNANVDEERWAVEERKRYTMRKELFPRLPDDYVIFADFNQLYKCDPKLFHLWLRILKRVPKSILWLLRFPASGEPHLLREARDYVGDEVASRVIFTDVAPKHIHIHRGRIADLFLDSTECNAHTTAADILWSGTPVLTWPRHLHKMCSRVAASIVHATGFGSEMTVHSETEYEDRAVQFAESLEYTYQDENGVEVQASDEEETQRFSSDLEADPNSVAAQRHFNNSSASRAKGTTSSSASGDTKKRPRSGSMDPPPPAPTPTNVVMAQAAKFSDTNAVTDPALAASIPPRHMNALPHSPVFHGAVTRHGLTHPTSSSRVSLTQLRKQLFLSRDSTSKLFDTQQWVRDLEKGYTEAWQRWVLGVDTEDSPETAALDPNSPLGQRIQRSGHIWVADL